MIKQLHNFLYISPQKRLILEKIKDKEDYLRLKYEWQDVQDKRRLEKAEDDYAAANIMFTAAFRNNALSAEDMQIRDEIDKLWKEYND